MGTKDKNTLSDQQLNQLSKEQLLSLCRVLQDKNNEYEKRLDFLTEQIFLSQHRRFGHADVTALISSDGSIAATYYYDAFGNILEQTGAVDNNITYAGYQYDEETGLYYLNARMYDPKIARFLQEDTYRGDPNDPLSLNLYTYCSNEPIMYADPTGHKGEWWNPGTWVDNFVTGINSITGSNLKSDL